MVLNTCNILLERGEAVFSTQANDQYAAISVGKSGERLEDTPS